MPRRAWDQRGSPAAAGPGASPQALRGLLSTLSFARCLRLLRRLLHPHAGHPAGIPCPASPSPPLPQSLTPRQVGLLARAGERGPSAAQAREEEAACNLGGPGTLREQDPPYPFSSREMKRRQRERADM